MMSWWKGGLFAAGLLELGTHLHIEGFPHRLKFPSHVCPLLFQDDPQLPDDVRQNFIGGAGYFRQDLLHSFVVLVPTRRRVAEAARGNRVRGVDSHGHRLTFDRGQRVEIHLPEDLRLYLWSAEAPTIIMKRVVASALHRIAAANRKDQMNAKKMRAAIWKVTISSAAKATVI
jgi:hypothetical protein